ncbi:MAG TPA: DUF3488 and transglutaminase-like domain-containing protein [Jatrophihabitans sp.]
MNALKSRNPASDQVVAAVTGAVAVGVVLTMLPLRSIFTDWSWLTTSILCGLPYWAITIGFRSRSEPKWWHSLLGLAASLLVLLWVFVPQHLGFGVLPTPASIDDVRALVNGAREALRDEHAPVQSTAALRLMTASAMVLLVVLTDVLGILLRRPLLAAAPLLEVLAVASATSSSAASPLWFAAAAAGFLIILVAGTRLQDRAWGPSVDGSAGRLGGARRMAVTGIVAALVVPLLLPSVSVNLLARAAHHDGPGGGPGGNGSGQIQLNNFASFSGSLKLSKPQDLLRVQVSSGQVPYYVRQEILDHYTDSGWSPSLSSSAISGTSLADQNFPIAPDTAQTNAAPYSTIDARITILGLGGNQLPLLANPQQLDPIGNGVWDDQTATVQQVDLKRGMSYRESVRQPNPTPSELRQAPDFTSSGDPAVDQRILSVPTLPAEVTDLAARITSGLSSEYDKANAISDYFTNNKNGFVYSLSATASDSRTALVTFLHKKQGFCQQYAGAAAVLMRAAGLPSRVVLGYSHPTPDNSGSFTVTTSDAHAWVEVYFTGIGWVPFDPTPFAGPDIARAVALPWATHAVSPDGSTKDVPSTGASRSNRTLENPGGAAAAPTLSGNGRANGWQSPAIVLGVLLFLIVASAGPQFVRRRQRRRRLARARSTGSPEPLWQELAASAADRESLWPDTLTVGQVPNWLGRHGVDERGTEAVTALARRVEKTRYSAHPDSSLEPEVVMGLDQAMKRWARRAERCERLLSWWLPRSLTSRTRWRR